MNEELSARLINALNERKKQLKQEEEKLKNAKHDKVNVLSRIVKECYDQEVEIKNKITSLNMLINTGEISGEDYKQAEDEIAKLKKELVEVVSKRNKAFDERKAIKIKREKEARAERLERINKKAATEYAFKFLNHLPEEEKKKYEISKLTGDEAIKIYKEYLSQRNEAYNQTIENMQNGQNTSDQKKSETKTPEPKSSDTDENKIQEDDLDHDFDEIFDDGLGDENDKPQNEQEDEETVDEEDLGIKGEEQEAPKKLIDKFKDKWKNIIIGAIVTVALVAGTVYTATTGETSHTAVSSVSNPSIEFNIADDIHDLKAQVTQTGLENINPDASNITSIGDISFNNETGELLNTPTEGYVDAYNATTGDNAVTLNQDYAENYLQYTYDTNTGEIKSLNDYGSYTEMYQDIADNENIVGSFGNQIDPSQTLNQTAANGDVSYWNNISSGRGR